jgi:threonine dehydratase
MMLIPPQRIDEAYRNLRRPFKASPQFVSEAISELAGCTILCKDETRNPIRSFKGRGAHWWMTRHPDIDCIVCASAGNFGMAMAYVGSVAGIEVHVFVSEHASPVKVAGIERLGGRIHVAGTDFDAAKEVARGLAGQNGWLFVEDGLDVEIAEGAGTIGVELSRYRDGIEAVFVPIGNGALASGVGSYLKASRPATRIVGVCADGAPATARSWTSRRVVTTDLTTTIADGVAVRNPIPEAVEILVEAVDEIVLVPDSSIKAAMQLLYKLEGIVAEPAGALSLAGALKVSGDWVGSTIATLVCGGNVDSGLRRRWLGEP